MNKTDNAPWPSEEHQARQKQKHDIVSIKVVGRNNGLNPSQLGSRQASKSRETSIQEKEEFRKQQAERYEQRVGDFDEALDDETDFVHVGRNDRDLSAEFKKMSINDVMNMSPTASKTYAEGLSKSG